MTIIKKIISPFARIQYNSPVILTFAILAFAALVISSFSDWAAFNLFAVYRSPFSPLYVVRLFGSVLGHANIEHFLGNFLMILMLGPMLEEKYGSKKLLIMILLTALVTGLLHILFLPNTAAMGASGVVFMLILLSSFANLTKGRIPLTLVLCVFVFIGREIVNGLGGADNISQFGHILGGVLGAGFGVWLNKDKILTSKD